MILCAHFGQQSYSEVVLPAFEVVERCFEGLHSNLPGDQVLLPHMAHNMHIPSAGFFGGCASAALLAALFLALSPWHIYWSQNARSYSMVLFFCLVASGAAYYGFRRRSWWMLLTSVAFFFLGGFSHPSAFVVVAAALLYLLLVMILHTPQRSA